MVPQRMLRRTLQAEREADAREGPEHRAYMKLLITKGTPSKSEKQSLGYGFFGARYLLENGYVERVSRGVYKITQKGQKLLDILS